LFSGYKVGHDTMEEAINLSAKGCIVDSLRDWAEQLPTLPRDESVAVLRELAHRGFAGSGSYGAELFVKRHLVGAIARAYVPGYKHDHTLILAGKKSLRKTSTLAALFRPGWFRAQMPSLTERDGSHAVCGFFGVSFDEMGRIMREDFQVVRDFITRQEDIFRQFGNGDLVRALRRNVFFGTTNHNADLIRDPEPDRRWLLIHCDSRCDLEWVAENRERIWAAAKSLYLAKEPSNLSIEEEAQYLEVAQADYVQHAESEGVVQRYLATLSPADLARTGVTTFEVYRAVYGGL
jgi:predicted P-loop ATPase